MSDGKYDINQCQVQAEYWDEGGYYQDTYAGKVIFDINGKRIVIRIPKESDALEIIDYIEWLENQILETNK